MRKKIKIRKTLEAALLTASGECLLLLLPMGGSLVKILLGYGGGMALMLWLFFRPQSRKAYNKLLLISYGIMILLGGSLEGLESLFHVSRWSVMGTALAGGGISLGILRMYEHWKREREQKLLHIKLFFSETKTCSLVALLDTGNELQEPISGHPVSVVEELILPKEEGIFLEERFRIVPYRSVGEANGLMEAYIIEKMEIEREGEIIIIPRPVIGIAKEKLASDGRYQMILHPRVLG